MGSEYQPNHETLAAPLAHEDYHALASEAAGWPAALSRVPMPKTGLFDSDRAAFVSGRKAFAGPS